MYRKDLRVEMGVGCIHNPPRAQYSEETRNLIKSMTIIIVSEILYYY